MAKDFQTYMLESIARLKSDYGWTQDSDAFAQWAICHVSSLTSREVYEDVYVGSKGDKSLDGFYIDHDARLVSLYQCKYQESAGNYGDRAALVDFVGVVNRLKDEKASREFKNPEIRRCARRYRETVSDRYRVAMHFIVYANLTPSVRDEAKHVLLSPRHDLEIWDFQRLEKLYYEGLAYEEPISEPVMIDLTNSTHADMKTVKADAIVVSIPATQLYDLRKKYGRRLFSEDIRYFLGETPINRQIARTLELPSDRQFFWYYNNGISITCSDYDFKSEDQKVRIVGPQVINGCQTAESVFNFGELRGRHNLENFSILTKIIRTKDEKIGRSITARTNTQNPQSVRNLCANLESQVNLKQLFDDLPHPVFYQTKDGEWESLPSSQKDRYVDKDGRERILDNIDVAPAYIAFARDDEELNPVEARRRQSEFFDITKKYYAEIFPDESRTPYEYLVPTLLLYYVEARLKQIRKEVNESAPMSPEELELSEIRSSVRYAKWFIMGLGGWLTRRHYAVDKFSPDIAKLLASHIGDFERPSELANYLTDWPIELIEEYTDAERGDDEDFDPALAFRQSGVWRRLVRRGLRKYLRQMKKGEFQAQLFPKL